MSTDPGQIAGGVITRTGATEGVPITWFETVVAGESGAAAGIVLA